MSYLTKNNLSMNEEFDAEESFMMCMCAHLFSFVRSLIKDERVIATVVRESLESLERNHVEGESNIKSYLMATAKRFSMNYLKKSL